MIPLAEAIGSSPQTVGSLLDWPARLYPERPAIQSGKTVAFGELWERSLMRAGVLANFGVRRFERWGLIADNSPEFFISLFAMSQLGAVVAPVSINQTSERLRQSIAGARLAGIVAPQTYRLDAAVGVALDDYLQVFAEARPDIAPVRQLPIDVDPALIIWSSGSTRAARGVVLEHAAVLANIRSNVCALGLHDDDRTLVVLPVVHAYALIHQCLCHLAVGATVCFSQQPLFAPTLCRQLEEFEITTLTTAPPVLKILVEGLRRTGRTCPQLRLVTVGAGRADRETLAEAMDLLPHARFAITYGLTEAGPRVATNFVDRDNIDSARIGKPLPNMEMHLEPSANGASEIRVRGRSLMRSYADEPYAEGSDHSLLTSDLGEVRDGVWYVRGRLDRAINRGGVLLAVEPIEEVIRRHPAVESVLVEAAPHPFWGQTPVATISVRDGHAAPSPEELRQFCARWLTPEEIPARFEVSREGLTISAKDRMMLAQVDDGGGSERC